MKIKNYFQIATFLVLSIYFTSCGTTQKTTSIASENTQEKPYVLLVSFDGFRYDYAEKFNLPNFKKLAEDGASTAHMIPSFPSKTFPNHYAIITGMYPGNNGLVDNNFYDTDRNDYYSIGNRKNVEDPYYYSGTPLWQWLQSKGMKTASYYWIGSEAPINGEYPTYYYIYEDNTPNDERIDQVINWFKLPKNERPRFVTLYFSLVDTQGHNHGPNSPEVEAATKEADRLLDMLLDKIKTINLPINTIVTSDHGMIEMDSKKDIFVNIEPITKALEDKAIIVNSGMHTHVYLKDGAKLEDVLTVLRTELPAHVKVYPKSDIPYKWHYNKDNRVGDILIVAEAPYYMVARENDPITQKRELWGTHGYDPSTTPEMGAIFYAVGPNIKKNIQIEPFENIHIFPFVTKIIGVDNPKDIDGDTEVLAPILVE